MDGNYSDEELEIEENEFGAVEEESPQSHHHYLQDSMPHGMSQGMQHGMTNGMANGMSNGMSGNMAHMVSTSMRLPGPMAAPNQLMPNHHLIQQPI